MVKKQIRVPLPKNIAENEKYLYQEHSTYEWEQLKIKQLKNVFVTFTGLCINQGGLIKESHHNYPVQYDDYLNEAALYFNDANEHPENLIHLDDDHTYLLIHHPWYNYYHWICEPIFRLWMARRKLNKVILLLPEYYKDADFITGSLEPFKVADIFYIPNGKSMMVKNLCLPQIKPICDSYNYLHVKQVRAFYQDYVRNEKKFDLPKIDKLYISRELAGRRSIVNETDVLKVIERFGFTIFYPEKHTFLEQVSVFAGVKYLIGTHGSGLTNMLFMNKGTSVLELHKNKTNELDHPSYLFWYMADALGVNYFHQSCETVGKEDYFTGDYLIDIDLLEQNIIQMLG